LPAASWPPATARAALAARQIAACALLALALSAGAQAPVPAMAAPPLAAPPAATATEAKPAAAAPPGAAASRPKVALVLSGGGARGFAHIGVLRALRDLRVPVDLVVGVSMGAVVGGAWAAGRSVDELAGFVRGTDWAEIVADRPPRRDLSFRRREEDLLLPSRIEFGLRPGGVQPPPAAAASIQLEDALGRLIPAGAGVLAVDALGVPFRSVASDLLTGELVELRDVPLFDAVRASLAVPGVFAPVRVGGRLLVDGGLVRNLPVDIARGMGAGIVIAVNVGTPLAGEEELGSAFGVAQQMLNILTEQNVQRSIRELGTADLLITPALNGIGFLDFAQGERAMAAGLAAAQALAPRLAALALPAEGYDAQEWLRLASPAARGQPLPLASLAVLPTPRTGEAALARRAGLAVGDTITPAEAVNAAKRLRGSGEFERVRVDVTEQDGSRAVRLEPTEADWAFGRLRLGLALASDFNNSSAFTVSAMHVLPWVNRWGAELRTLARIGAQRGLSVQLWQPLAPGSDWYAAPEIDYIAGAGDVFVNGRRQLRAGFSTTRLTLAAGRQLADWGDLRLGISRELGRARLLLPETDPPTGTTYQATTQFAEWRVDTLDTLALPSRGQLINLRWEHQDIASGSGAGAGGLPVASITAQGLVAGRWGDWATHLYGEWSRAQVDTAPLALGGFLRLSGTADASINAHTVVLGRMVWARRIGRMPVGLGGAVRLGFSLEAGGGFAEGEALRLNALRKAASSFVAVDTRFGPLYLGAGASRPGGSSIYLYLGPIW